jgi:thiamine-phosphate diphosphorylase
MSGGAPLPRLMLVTDRRRTRGRDLVTLVAAAVRGGVGWILVREPDLTDDALRELVVRIRTAVLPGTLLSVRGSARVARTLGLGLHLPAAAPRAGPGASRHRPYGRSVHDDAELASALEDGADYVVAGTIFATVSKPGRRAGGLALLERTCRQAHPVPVYAIGGIGVARVPAVVHVGARGIAVCGALLEDNDPGRVAEALTLALQVAGATPG